MLARRRRWWASISKLVGEGSKWEEVPTQTILVSNYATTFQESLLQNPHNSTLEKICYDLLKKKTVICFFNRNQTNILGGNLHRARDDLTLFCHIYNVFGVSYKKICVECKFDESRLEILGHFCNCKVKGQF